jgi:hypothetical protein
MHVLCPIDDAHAATAGYRLDAVSSNLGRPARLGIELEAGG